MRAIIECNLCYLNPLYINIYQVEPNHLFNSTIILMIIKLIDDGKLNLDRNVIRITL